MVGDVDVTETRLAMDKCGVAVTVGLPGELTCERVSVTMTVSSREELAKVIDAFGGIDHFSRSRSWQADATVLCAHDGPVAVYVHLEGPEFAAPKPAERPQPAALTEMYGTLRVL